ncbi:NosR/NirI family transcriptional regulator, nitrous oxide reductase regulator [uncultured Gammaproteobacteria bacterium]
MQELISEVARTLGIRQITLKFGVHERLWAIKYILFLALFGLSLDSMALAERFAEVEPFKTVVLLHFIRDWPYALYAAVLLALSVCMERVFCRYLCPLGAALAIPARNRLFDWLKRRKQCGYECSLCARQCMVQSIHSDGKINPNECLYCLHCQVVYFDHDTCPPLVIKRTGRGRRLMAGGETSSHAAMAANPQPEG